MAPRAGKYAFLVGDGMADHAYAELGGKTPLEHANTPNLDVLARSGRIGRVATTPEGYPPGSDVGNLALLGFDPARYYTGRAPIEAVAMGVRLAPGSIALRCNLVTLDEGLMRDYSGGHFTDQEATELIGALKTACDGEGLSFHVGVDYRHLLVWNGLDARDLALTPPHDITGKPFAEHLPSGGDASRLLDLMDKARAVLARSDTNVRRRAQGKLAATDIWLWGQGAAMSLPGLKDLYELRGKVISAVNLVNGLGLLAGLETVAVPGATGYLGTNYAGKVRAAEQALEAGNFVYLHVEAPDETSHEGSLAKKIQAIEEFDANVVGPMLALRERWPELRLAVAPDHPTYVSTRTHSGEPVPFAICGSGIAPSGAPGYSETAASRCPPVTGTQLFRELVLGSSS